MQRRARSRAFLTQITVYEITGSDIIDFIAEKQCSCTFFLCPKSHRTESQQVQWVLHKKGTLRLWDLLWNIPWVYYSRSHAMLCITFRLHIISFLYLHLHNNSWEVAFMIELEVRALKIFAHSAWYVWVQEFCARLPAKISSKKCVNLWKICNIQWTNIFSVIRHDITQLYMSKVIY